MQGVGLALAAQPGPVSTTACCSSAGPHSISDWEPPNIISILQSGKRRPKEPKGFSREHAVQPELGLEPWPPDLRSPALTGPGLKSH